MNPTEPAFSRDGGKFVFVARGRLYLAESGKLSQFTDDPVSNPQFFPDGGRLIFVTGLPGHRSILSRSLNREDTQTLVSGRDCFQPSVSPDGRLLAFSCSATGARHIWVRDLKSGISRQLTHGFCNNDSPAWFADSGSILFASDCGRGLGLPALYRLKVTRRNQVPF